MEPILCFTCQEPIGMYYDAVLRMIEIYNKAHMTKDVHIDNQKLDTNAQNDRDITCIFKVLGVTRLCCKSAILTNKQVSDLKY